MEESRTEVVNITDSLGQSATFYCRHKDFCIAWIKDNAPYMSFPVTVRYGFEIYKYIDTAIITGERRDVCTEK